MNICKKCNQENLESSNFCASCGEPLLRSSGGRYSSGSTNSSPFVSRVPSSDNLIKISIGICAAMILIFFLPWVELGPTSLKLFEIASSLEKICDLVHNSTLKILSLFYYACCLMPVIAGISGYKIYKNRNEGMSTIKSMLSILSVIMFLFIVITWILNSYVKSKLGIPSLKISLTLMPYILFIISIVNRAYIIKKIEEYDYARYVEFKEYEIKREKK